MKVTAELLIKTGIGPTQAKAFADPLQAACERFDINTLYRLSAFLSQAAHESVLFTRLEENLFYTTPERIRSVFGRRVPPLMLDAVRRNPQALANLVYANRLGNTDAGDGWKYRGRGIFQLTGKANYQAAQDALGAPYVLQPELVVEPTHAALTAAHFWHSTGCNADADKGDMRMVTKKINGPAMLGLAQRLDVNAAILEALA